MIKRYKQNEISKLANILKKDGVISVPTDTVYGLCAKIDSEKAYDRLMKIKNRPHDKLFPIMCANEEQIKSIAIINETSKKIIKGFMPGPITIILLKKDNIPDFISNGEKTIAVRLATSKVLEELIKNVGSPIFMTSANQSGEKTCTNLYEIEKECPMIDGMMEGDICFGQASTIVDCTSDKIKILRKGPISEEQIINYIK